MHIDDSSVLKEICFFLENYQLNIHMNWIVVNSNPQMHNKDPSSEDGL